MSEVQKNLDQPYSPQQESPAAEMAGVHSNIEYQEKNSQALRIGLKNAIVFKRAYLKSTRTYYG